MHSEKKERSESVHIREYQERSAVEFSAVDFARNMSQSTLTVSKRQQKGYGMVSKEMYTKIDRLILENEVLSTSEARWERHTKREEEEKLRLKKLEQEDADRSVRAALDEARIQRKQEFDSQLKQEVERQNRPKDLKAIRLVDLQRSRKELDELLLEDHKATKKNQRSLQRRQWIDHLQAKGGDVPTEFMSISSDDSDEDIAGCDNFAEFASRKFAKKVAQHAAQEANRVKGLRPPGEDGKRRLNEHRARQVMKAGIVTSSRRSSITALPSEALGTSMSQPSFPPTADVANATVNALYKRMLQTIEERREAQRADDERKRLLYAAEEYANRQYFQMRKDLRKNVLAEAFGDDFDEHAVEEVQFIEERPDYSAVITTTLHPAGVLQLYRDPNHSDEDVARPVFQPLIEAAAQKYVDVLIDPFAFLSAPPCSKELTGVNVDEGDHLIRNLEAGNFRDFDASPLDMNLEDLEREEFATPLSQDLNLGSNGSEFSMFGEAKSTTASNLAPSSLSPHQPVNVPLATASSLKRCLEMHSSLCKLKAVVERESAQKGLPLRESTQETCLVRRMVRKPSDRAHAVVAQEDERQAVQSTVAIPCPVENVSQVDSSALISGIRKQLLDFEDSATEDANEREEKKEDDEHLSLDDMLHFAALTGLRDWVLKDATENFVPPTDQSYAIQVHELKNVGKSTQELAALEDFNGKSHDDLSEGSSSIDAKAFSDDDDGDSAIADARRRIQSRQLSRRRSMARNSIYGKTYLAEQEGTPLTTPVHFLYEDVHDFKKRVIPDIKKFLVSITTTRISATLSSQNPDASTTSTVHHLSSSGGGLVHILAHRNKKRNIGSSYYGTRPKVLSDADQAALDEELLENLREYHEKKIRAEVAAANSSVVEGGGWAAMRRRSSVTTSAEGSGLPRARTPNPKSPVEEEEVHRAKMDSKEVLVRELIFKRDHPYQRRSDVEQKRLEEKTATLALQRNILQDLKPGLRLLPYHQGVPTYVSGAIAKSPPSATAGPQTFEIDTDDSSDDDETASPTRRSKSPSTGQPASSRKSSERVSEASSNQLLFTPSAQFRIGNALKGVDISANSTSRDDKSVGIEIGASSVWYNDEDNEVMLLNDNVDVRGLEELLGTTKDWMSGSGIARGKEEKERHRKEKRRQLLLAELEGNVHLPSDLVQEIEDRKAMRRQRVALEIACNEVAATTARGGALGDEAGAEADSSIGDLSLRNGSHSTLLQGGDSISATRGARSMRIKGSIKGVPNLSTSFPDQRNTPDSASLRTESDASQPPSNYASRLHTSVGANTPHAATPWRSSPLEGYSETRDGPITHEDWEKIDALASDEDEDVEGCEGNNDDTTGVANSSRSLYSNSSSQLLSARQLVVRKRDLLRLLSAEGQDANLQLRKNRTLALGLGMSGSVGSALPSIDSRRFDIALSSLSGANLSQRLQSIKSMTSHMSVSTDGNSVAGGHTVLPPIRESSDGNRLPHPTPNNNSKRTTSVTFPAASGAIGDPSPKVPLQQTNEMPPIPASPGNSSLNDSERGDSTPSVASACTSNTFLDVGCVGGVLGLDRTAPGYKDALRKKVQLNKILLDRMSQRKR